MVIPCAHAKFREKKIERPSSIYMHKGEYNREERETFALET